jgi:hypothetical protein
MMETDFGAEMVKSYRFRPILGADLDLQFAQATDRSTLAHY